MKAGLLASDEGAHVDTDDFWRIEKRLLFSFWLPNVLYALSYGAGLVALPLFLLRTLGMPYVYMGGYKVAQELAELVANNPSAWVVGRFGWRGGLGSGGCGFLVASVMLALAALYEASLPKVLAYAVFLCAYFFQCGSMKFFNRGSAILTSELVSHNRGRHSNLQAGLRYITTALGPWLAGVLMASSLGVNAVFSSMVMIGSFAAVSIYFSLKTTSTIPAKAPKAKAALGERVAVDTGYSHFLRDPVTRREWLLASVSCLIIVLLRGCFNMMVPIQATSLGLESNDVALTFVWCNSCGFSMFWIGGMILDKLGRRWSAVPACALFGAAFLLLGRSQGASGMHGAAVFFGFGETISGGIKRSLKADFTDRAFRHRLSQTRDEIGGEGDVAVATLHKARFSAMIDNALDSVGIIYPVMLAFVAQTYSPFAACCCCACLGVLGVLVFSFVIEETLKRQNSLDGVVERRLTYFLLVSLSCFSCLFVYLSLLHSSSPQKA
eukprot:TRINITY_DN21403_c0_g1_i1.p1 TRINITY_DN21403_c0_g1~~TRINITY_DN21403_c0_g1_i1.p1  ORF type:complete len:512 (+),score=58.17 TRINITY_DN21403_c0_g1_i1:54-1538(+)